MTNLARALEVSTVVAIGLSLSLLAVVISGTAAGTSAAGDRIAAKPTPPPSSPGSRQTAPTAEEARAFIEGAEKRLLEFTIKADRAGWVQSNFITDDTERMAAE